VSRWRRQLSKDRRFWQVADDLGRADYGEFLFVDVLKRFNTPTPRGTSSSGSRRDTSTEPVDQRGAVRSRRGVFSLRVTRDVAKRSAQEAVSVSDRPGCRREPARADPRADHRRLRRAHHAARRQDAAPAAPADALAGAGLRHRRRRALPQHHAHAWGYYSSGKTTFLLKLFAAAQNYGRLRHAQLMGLAELSCRPASSSRPSCSRTRPSASASSARSRACSSARRPSIPGTPRRSGSTSRRSSWSTTP
jgi:hypothetical protein